MTLEIQNQPAVLVDQKNGHNSSTGGGGGGSGGLGVGGSGGVWLSSSKANSDLTLSLSTSLPVSTGANSNDSKNSYSSTLNFRTPPVSTPWRKFFQLKLSDHEHHIIQRKRKYILQNPLTDQQIDNIMNRSRNGPKIDLRLNLSPPRAQQHNNSFLSVQSESESESVSPPSSCVSSELMITQGQGQEEDEGPISSMVLVGCPRCLMYVMLSECDPKCPKCKSSVLLDFVRDRAAGAGAPTGITTVKRTRNI